ncbi:MAG TPA: hypothetical protein VHA52_07120 [Candidatus Babeliaceae bacterium]|nr:hypothetical protein [Candidatus Babeliaceae bacterium]
MLTEKMVWLQYHFVEKILITKACNAKYQNQYSEGAGDRLNYKKLGRSRNFHGSYNCIFIRFTAILEADTFVYDALGGEFYQKILGDENAI